MRGTHGKTTRKWGKQSPGGGSTARREVAAVASYAGRHSYPEAGDGGGAVPVGSMPPCDLWGHVRAMLVVAYLLRARAALTPRLLHMRLRHSVHEDCRRTHRGAPVPPQQVSAPPSCVHAPDAGVLAARLARCRADTLQRSTCALPSSPLGWCCSRCSTSRPRPAMQVEKYLSNPRLLRAAH